MRPGWRPAARCRVNGAYGACRRSHVHETVLPERHGGGAGAPPPTGARHGEARKNGDGALARDVVEHDHATSVSYDPDRFAVRRDCDPSGAVGRHDWTGNRATCVQVVHHEGTARALSGDPTVGSAFASWHDDQDRRAVSVSADRDAESLDGPVTRGSINVLDHLPGTDVDDDRMRPVPRDDRPGRAGDHRPAKRRGIVDVIVADDPRSRCECPQQRGGDSRVVRPTTVRLDREQGRDVAVSAAEGQRAIDDRLDSGLSRLVTRIRSLLLCDDDRAHRYEQQTGGRSEKDAKTPVLP